MKGAKGKAKPRPEPEPKRKPGNKQAVAADDLPGKRYSRMYYKAANAYGLRQNFGEKRQVISISKKVWPNLTCKASPSALWSACTQEEMRLRSKLGCTPNLRSIRVDDSHVKICLCF